MSNEKLVRLSSERLSVRVAVCLRDHGPQMVGSEVVAKLGESEARVKAALYRLERDGHISRHGKYPSAMWEYHRLPNSCGMRPMTVTRRNKLFVPQAQKPSPARAVNVVATAGKHVPSTPMPTKRRSITELWELCERDPMPESRAAVWHYIR